MTLQLFDVDMIVEEVLSQSTYPNILESYNPLYLSLEMSKLYLDNGGFLFPNPNTIKMVWHPRSGDLRVSVVVLFSPDLIKVYRFTENYHFFNLEDWRMFFKQDLSQWIGRDLSYWIGRDPK